MTRRLEGSYSTQATTSERVGDALIWIGTMLLWAICVIVVVGMLTLAFGWVIFPMSGEKRPSWAIIAARALGPIAGLMLFAVLIAGMLGAIRRRRTHAIMAYLEQSMRLNLPLPAMLRAAERAEGPRTSRALQILRTELERGQSVHDALRVAVPATPPRTFGLIASAERSGRLPQALGRMMREAVSRFAGRPGEELYLRWYPLTTLLVLLMVTTFVYVYVVPKFFEIFQDFSIELPPPTRVLVNTWSVLAVPLCVVVGLITVVYLARLLAKIFMPGHGGRGPQRLTWYLPGIGAMTRWRSLADVCHVLADATEAGHPLDWSLTEASRSGTNAVLAERLAVWADHARAGVPAAEGARRADMPPLLVGMLRTAGSSTGGAEPTEMFRFLARYYDSQFARSTVIIQAALVPAISIVMGVVVASIIVAVMMPLVSLVDNLSNIVWRM